VLVFDEPFGRVRAISFGLIWLALAVYLVDARRTRRTRRADAGPPG
jgi:EamA domain-containing membrane protein RarD